MINNTISRLYNFLKGHNRVKYTKYETCAILHRFHVLYISRENDSKIEQSHAF